MKRTLLISFTILLVFLSFKPVPLHIPAFNEDDSVYLPVLMYHSVLRDAKRTGKYTVTPEGFEDDIRYLEDNGYTIVTAKELIRFVYNNEPLPKKPVLLTFDDGMYNNFKYVAPILIKHNASAVFSVVGSYTDEYSESNVVNPSYSYMRWCDINELSRLPNIEFSAHSYDLHKVAGGRRGAGKIKTESLQEYINTFLEDTKKMQSEFFSNCNFRPIIYAYPFGEYTAQSEQILKDMGFLVTFSCTEGINRISRDTDCLYLLKRYNRDGRLSTKEFFAKIKL